MSIPVDILCGLSDTHVIEVSPGQRIHRQSVSAFTAMQQAAQAAGHNLQIASGFRDYHRQAAIWQRKTEALGAMPTDTALHEILRWSAMPGASRHHWGSDMDIYDPDALGADKLQLEPWEYADNGPFAPLTQWLQANAKKFGFYWPYARDLGGVNCEPWHLSYAPLSTGYQQALTPALLSRVWQAHPPAHLGWLSEHVESLFRRYVANVCPADSIEN